MKTKIKNKLKRHKLTYIEKEINHGTQFILTNGVNINVYNTDKVLVQGNENKVKEVKELLGIL